MSGDHITEESWKIQPIEHPASAPWSFHLSSHDVSKMLKGFQPRDMDDRWLCQTDGPDSQGDMVVHFCRSWTGDEYFQIKAKRETGDDNGAKVIEIKWNEGNEHNPVDENEAKRSVVGFCRGLLGCQLEDVPEEFLKTK